MRSSLLDVGLPVVAGLVIFFFAYLAVSAISSPPASNDAVTPTPVIALPVPTDSVALKVAAGHIVISVPLFVPAGSASALRPGDHIDILATVPASPGQPALAGTVEQGAVVLQAPGGGSPVVVLLDVPEASVATLTYLTGSGAHLTYVVYAGTGAVPTPPVLDEGTARQRLGLPTLVTSRGTSTAPPASAATVGPVAPTAVPAPATATPAPSVPTPASAETPQEALPSPTP